MKKCNTCNNPLSGRQTKFCCRQCKNEYTNNKHQNYQAQQKRGRKRKLELIKLKGAKCNRCNYNSNYAALEFHHIKKGDKLFQLDLRSLSNRKWDVILSEAEKCILLCSNCHTEEHNPDCLLTK